MYTEFDRRQLRRSKVDLTQTTGDFKLEIDGKNIPILDSNHISISGMDIKASQAAKPRSSIKLHFQTADIHLAIDGHITWCAESISDDSSRLSKSLYAMGIEFDPTSIDDNSLLFLALRRYVDRFE